MTKPKVVNQGKTIVEHDGNGYLVLLPDGTIFSESSKKKILKLVQKWYNENVPTDAIGVGEIEWRPKDD